MEENKDLIPDAETEIKSQEVVAEAVTTDEVKSEEVTAEVVEKDNVKGKKSKKDKKPLSKRNKIIIATAVSVVGVTILSLFIWLMVLLFGPGVTQDLSSTPLKVDMANEYYVGTQNTIDLSKVFPNGSGFTASKNAINGNNLTINSEDDFTLTYKQGEESITKNVTVVKDAINVSTFDELVTNINDGKKVVVQNASLKAPKLEGINEDAVPTMTVKNDVYGNGTTINVHEIVGTRARKSSSNGKKLAALTKGTDYKKATYGDGYSAFTIVPKADGSKVLFRDVHITGNDMKTTEGGDIEGVTEEEMTGRGVKLFSGYGALLFSAGNETEKAKAEVKHCVFENAGKVVHISSSVIDIEGCIVRNAADTAVSIETAANKASTINMKNNVIANSLTGGILFYCYDKGITEENAAASWNTLNIDGFLDIYNWKQEKSLAFLPETESATLANIANAVVKSEIPKKEYDSLKGKAGGKKYIHFAIIKIRTCDFGKPDSVKVKQNGSTVTGLEKVGFTDSKANGQANGFPIPSIAENVMTDIDVWGYYGKSNGAVQPLDGFTEEMLPNLYKELREGRK